MYKDYQIEDIQHKNNCLLGIQIKKNVDQSEKSEHSKRHDAMKKSEKMAERFEQFSDDNNGSQILEDETDFLDVRFLITSGIRDIDQEIFHIIHENGLVYNGRLIVKNNF